MFHDAVAGCGMYSVEMDGAIPPPLSLESRAYPREKVVSGQGTCELRLKRDFFLVKRLSRELPF